MAVTKIPTAGITIPDNDKLNFGTGNDLEIYHSSSASFIDETGTGTLAIRGAGNVEINSLTNESMANFINDGAVELFHNASKKLETTSSGVTVTGATNSTVMPTLSGVALSAHGTNSNGMFFKFADGTMICTAEKTVTEHNNGPTAGNFYYSNAGTWTYPVAFSGTVRVIVGTYGGHYNGISAKAPSVGTSSCTYVSLSINSTTNDQTLILYAIGDYA